MARRDDKYGSSYDPNRRGGKIERPQEKLDPECGNPNCSECYPERARQASVTRNEGRNPAYGGNPFEDYATITSLMLEAYIQSGREQRADPNAKPATYVAARKEVEDWIVTAPEQAFDDIVGNAEALDQLRDAIQAPVKHAELYKAYGMKMPKGALLSGPPGCGKTMFARAAASEMKKLYGKATEFISISGSELQSMFVGETEQRIKAIFTYAREYKLFHGHPLLVFMDEAEVLLPDRTGRVRRVASWEESQVATFLAEMDGMQESGAFVLLATNRPEVIDQAVLRDGRCDFKIVVKRPTYEAVEVILTKNFEGVLIGGDSREALVMAALEMLFDPHKVILDIHALRVNFEKEEIKDFGGKHFLLEHIVSGAMAASIPGRAKRYAFARDKVSGVAKGVTVADVVQAVKDLFEENRNLDHAFALDEFKATMLEKIKGENHDR